MKFNIPLFSETIRFLHYTSLPRGDKKQVVIKEVNITTSSRIADFGQRFWTIFLCCFFTIILITTVGTKDMIQQGSIEKEITTSDKIVDFTKTPTQEYGKYEIYDKGFLGFGKGTKQKEIELTDNSNYCLSDCYAIKNITLTQRGSLADDIRYFKFNYYSFQWIPTTKVQGTFSYNDGRGWTPYTLGT